jgi:16S rRNA (cytidine1402-2'-O)-methyltransferase
LAQLLKFVTEDTNQQKGEIVLLVAGHISETISEVDETSAKVLAVLLKELPLKKAAALTAEITGVNKKVLYQYGVNSAQRKADTEN